MIYEGNVSDIAEHILQDHPGSTAVEPDEMTYEDDAEGLKVKYIFSRIYKWEDEKPDISFGLLMDFK